MAEKPTLEELFERAAIPRTATAAANRKIHRRAVGKAKALRFAQLLMKHNFSAPRAYAEFTEGRPGKNSAKWAFTWWQSKTVQLYLRELMEQAIESARAMTRDDLQEMLEISQDLIRGDVTSLVTVERIVNEDGSFRERLVLRDLRELSTRERMLIHKLKFKNGELVALDAYNRLDAMRTHMQLVQALHSRGGADGDFNSELAKRLSQAREKRIELEVAAGKVVRLPKAS